MRGARAWYTGGKSESMTSVEPARTKAYSADIGLRVVWQRSGMGKSFREIASSLHIGVGTAHRIYTRFVRTGDVIPLERSSRPECRKLDDLHELFIMGLICENPSLYIGEICSKIAEVTNITISTSTVCRVIHRNGMTRKKIKAVAKQRCSIYRGDFMAQVLQYSRNFFVWTDEVGTDRRDQLRKFGYALRGKPAICHRILTRGKRVSVMTAMTSSGVLAYETTTGSVNGDKFVDFIRGRLIPNMQPFPGEHSILILDNCSVHHAHNVKDMLASFGILVFFLPPYSPDMNPAEELFSHIKYYLKAHDDVIQATNDPLPIINSAFDIVPKSYCNEWITHSGYAL